MRGHDIIEQAADRWGPEAEHNGRAGACDGAGLLSGRVALVSGVGPNLGRAAALALARAGARLVIAARKQSSLDRLAEEVSSTGAEVLAVPGDTTSPEDRARLVRAIAERFGALDVVVNNAFAEEDWATFEGFDLARWQRPFEVNLFATLGLDQELLGLLKVGSGSSVITVNTLSTRVVNPVLGGYASSKRALMTAVQVMAKELGEHGVRFNCVAPGHMKGEALEQYFAYLGARRGVDPSVVEGEIAALTALGRIPTADEVAGAIVFLASDLARAITGQTLDVNAGRHMH
ncbi:MAG: SDR family oxidoreductase [Acidimicrobiales bacterium]